MAWQTYLHFLTCSFPAFQQFWPCLLAIPPLYILSFRSSWAKEVKPNGAWNGTDISIYNGGSSLSRARKLNGVKLCINCLHYESLLHITQWPPVSAQTKYFQQKWYLYFWNTCDLRNPNQPLKNQFSALPFWTLNFWHPACLERARVLLSLNIRMRVRATLGAKSSFCWNYFLSERIQEVTVYEFDWRTYAYFQHQLYIRRTWKLVSEDNPITNLIHSKYLQGVKKIPGHHKI